MNNKYLIAIILILFITCSYLFFKLENTPEPVTESPVVTDVQVNNDLEDMVDYLSAQDIVKNTKISVLEVENINLKRKVDAISDFYCKKSYIPVSERDLCEALGQ